VLLALVLEGVAAIALGSPHYCTEPLLLKLFLYCTPATQHGTERNGTESDVQPIDRIA
jgi:hypothetical protein